MAPDVRALVGDVAERVENRGLLYDRFSIPKVYGHARKLDDAGRWSVLRIVDRGTELLKREASDLRYRADGRDVEPPNAKRYRDQADMLGQLANVARLNDNIERIATDKTRRFAEDLNRAYGERVATFTATLQSRLMINMAGGVVENAGICLDRCFGLPFIPGSAVKGIARSQALWEIRESQLGQRGEQLRLAMAVFGFGQQDLGARGAWSWAAGDAGLAREIAATMGAMDFRGCACFLPAYAAGRVKIVADIVNPHYPKYYSGKSAEAQDDESPIPNVFPSVERDTSFGFAVLINRVPSGFSSEALLEAARQWVEDALKTKGSGAKTAAGYGWFSVCTPTGLAEDAGEPAGGEMLVPQTPQDPGDLLIEKWKGRLAATGNLGIALPELVALADDALLRRVFEAVIPDSEQRHLKRSRPYWQSFTSGRQGEAGKRILARLGLQLK